MCQIINLGEFQKHFLSGSKGLSSDITIWIAETNTSIISNLFSWSMKDNVVLS